MRKQATPTLLHHLPVIKFENLKKTLHFYTLIQQIWDSEKKWGWMVDNGFQVYSRKSSPVTFESVLQTYR